MLGPYVHHIDPVIASICGICLWWYGLSYALGFLNAHLFLRRNRRALGLSLASVYDLTLCLSIGVLVGGRSLVVFINEWAFYRQHLFWIPAIWLGGLATHGLIVGGAMGVFVFCRIYRRPFRPIFDALAIAAALIMGCGRIGNFIDGQIVGGVTGVAWAVKFPEALGFRHPVVLYDGLKNFLLIPVLLWVRKRGVPPGRVAALFVLLYASLRIPIDLFREYPFTKLGLPAGQTYNVVMSMVGVVLLLVNLARARRTETQAVSGSTLQRLSDSPTSLEPGTGVRWRRTAFAGLLAIALVIPSDATRDVPARYGHRHPGLAHSLVYPRLD